jgi:xanthine/CO dehydrogenase XdhC/CoxF family maturation factor
MKHGVKRRRSSSGLSRSRRAGRRAAIATVVRIDGSAYRRPGAKFLIEDDGRTIGGVSGGCLEADVREVAQRVLETGIPRLLHYDTSADDRMVWGLGLGCNGSVDIFVQPATEPRTLNVLNDLRDHLGRLYRSRSRRFSTGPASASCVSSTLLHRTDSRA